MRTNLLSSLLALIVVATGVAVGYAADPKTPAVTAKISHCLVSLIREAQVPAQEAGVLVALEAHEGMHVEEGSMLGQIDDSQMEMKKRVAQAEHQVAVAKAESDVNIRYNQAATKVAKAEYQLNSEANDKHEKTKPLTEMHKLWLQWQKSRLAEEQSELEQKTDKLTAEAKGVEVEAVDNDLRRRKVLAPLSGEVVEVFPHVGEWVNPGAPVVRIVQLDKLRVEGFVQLGEFAPDMVRNRPVTISVRVGPQRVEEFQGKIVFVDPAISAGQYRVFAEVVNRRAGGDGQWLLLPGMSPDMTIDTAAKLADAPLERRSAAR